MLATIKMPYDMKLLNSKLPSSKYETKLCEEDKQKTVVKGSYSNYLSNHSEYDILGSGSKIK